MAEAIEAAHRAGVIHRDLKPGNVMLTGTGAKVLDFGVAKALLAASDRGAQAGSAASTQLPTLTFAETAEGTLIGTLPYMAPEQVEGRQADPRSDIWALGCILHEMATGERPFGGASQASLIAAILTAAPEPVSHRRPPAPERLDWVVKRCLEKDPERRWQSARDVAIELEAIALSTVATPPPPSAPLSDPIVTSAPSASSVSSVPLEAVRPAVHARRWPSLPWTAAALAVIMVVAAGLWWTRRLAQDSEEDVNALLEAFKASDRSFAVVPFENLSGEPDLARLIDGIAVEMAGARGGEAAISILDREKVRSKGVCQAVERPSYWVYAGSVRRAGSEFRINASMTACPEGDERWSKSYAYWNEDPASVIDQTARRALAESQQVTNLDRGPPGSRRWFMSQRTSQATRRALDIAEIGLLRAPDDTFLWESFCNLHLQLLVEGWADPPAESIDALSRAGEEFVELSPRDWGGHSFVGFAGLFLGDREQMLRGFERARQLAPKVPATHAGLGNALGIAGRPQEALDALETAFEMSPEDVALPTWLSFQASTHFLAGRLEEARAAAQRGIALNTNDLFNQRATLYERLAATEALLGRREEARAALREAVRRRPALTVDNAAWKLAAADPEPRERYLEGLRLAGLGRHGSQIGK
jgi:tetratricopeptide (TPR) repeat protein